MKTQTGSRETGFSLVEVLLAILILGVTLTGMTRGVTTALSASKDVEVQTSAVLIAAGQIETLRAEGFIIEGEEEGSAGKNYEWKQTVVESTISGLFEVTVTITDTRTDKQIFELQTMLFDVPLDLNSTSREDEQRNRARGGRGG
jgi:prepilin-type N-terminal cleavage/methylation domain-containing protein